MLENARLKTKYRDGQWSCERKLGVRDNGGFSILLCIDQVKSTHFAKYYLSLSNRMLNTQSARRVDARMNQNEHPRLH